MIIIISFAFFLERSGTVVLSNAYNYINVLDKAADASWTRNDVLANNIANADTPGTNVRTYSLKRICPMRWREPIPLTPRLRRLI